MRIAQFALVVVCFGVASVSIEQARAAEPDTVLVLANGAEVRGQLLGMDDGNYEMRLADGRTMKYA